MILGTAIYQTARGVLIGLEEMSLQSFVNVLYSLIKTILGPALILLGYGVIGASFGYGIPYLISGLAACIVIFIKLRGTAKIVLPTIHDFKDIFIIETLQTTYKGFNIHLFIMAGDDK